MDKQPNELLLDWSRAGFENLDREQLKQAAEMLGVEYKPRTTDANLKHQLCTAIGMVSGELPAEDVEAIKADAPANGKLTIHAVPPNLSSSGRWGGRYRRVRLMRTDFYKNFIAFPIGWNGVTRYFHFDAELDMAWPYYQSLKGMIETRIIKELDSTGHRAVTKSMSAPAVPFSDLGDVPGTEHLPRSMLEYVRRLAHACDNFSKTERRDLIRVMRFLHGVGVNARLRNISDDDIRDEILAFVGIDVYAEAA